MFLYGHMSRLREGFVLDGILSIWLVNQKTGDGTWWPGWSVKTGLVLVTWLVCQERGMMLEQVCLSKDRNDFRSGWFVPRQVWVALDRSMQFNHTPLLQKAKDFGNYRPRLQLKIKASLTVWFLCLLWWTVREWPACLGLQIAPSQSPQTLFYTKQTRPKIAEMEKERASLPEHYSSI